MKLINRLLVAAALLGSGSIAFAQDHDRGHDRGDDHGHDRGHDDHGHRGNDRGHDDYRGRGDDHHGYGYRPPPRYYGHSGYGPGYGRPGYGRGHWERGRRYYGPTYVVRNYGYYRLRPPPYGYRWVRADNDFLLVAITTGIILDIAAH